jgi:RNA polymerase sigma-70 factor (ECF subfamily)
MQKELLEQCQKKDERAQRALYHLYKSRLMGVSRRYTRTREDAQDILQDAFVKIFNKIHQVSEAGKLEPWMRSIVIRTAIDHYHKLKRDDFQSYDIDDREVLDVKHENLLEHLSDEYLVKAINEIPDGCRFVFNLFEVEGYNHAEIAAMLGITEGTSRSQLHYAKHLLKQKLSRIGITRYEKFA